MFPTQQYIHTLIVNTLKYSLSDIMISIVYNLNAANRFVYVFVYLSLGEFIETTILTYIYIQISFI